MNSHRKMWTILIEVRFNLMDWRMRNHHISSFLAMESLTEAIIEADEKASIQEHDRYLTKNWYLKHSA